MADLTNILLEYWHIIIVAMLLIMISICFFFRFVVPALRLGGELKAAIAAMTDLRSRFNVNVVELGEIETKAMSGPALAHLWSEDVAPTKRGRSERPKPNRPLACHGPCR